MTSAHHGPLKTNVVSTVGAHSTNVGTLVHVLIVPDSLVDGACAFFEIPDDGFLGRSRPTLGRDVSALVIFRSRQTIFPQDRFRRLPGFDRRLAFDEVMGHDLDRRLKAVEGGSEYRSQERPSYRRLLNACKVYCQ
jgi:hypothetical protein